MHKRQTRKAEQLPLTGQDISLAASKKLSRERPVRRRRKRTSGNGGMILKCMIAVGVFISAILLLAKGTPTRSESRSQQALPLSEFKSLEYAFSHSRLVGLYFAAAWCPKSTPVTESIDEYLGAELLPPPSSSDASLPRRRATMSLVYVSSDRDEEAFYEYQRRNWISVPFHSEDRNNLKRHFRTCAKPEMDLLGIDRTAEIPTLLILDGETHALITANGAEDLDEYEESAVDHWVDLQNLMRAMENKFGGSDESIPQRHSYHHADFLSSLFA